jgi:uncharacterized protein YwgA
MAEEKNLKNQYDGAALLAFSVLKRLDSGKMNSFDERLRSQKIQYLAQSIGISPTYPFNLYVRGPYSPRLADALFKINEVRPQSIMEKFSSPELEQKFRNFKTFLDKKANRDLELIATLHWLMHSARLNKTEAIQKLERFKHSTPEENKKTFEALQCLPR